MFKFFNILNKICEQAKCKMRRMGLNGARSAAVRRPILKLKAHSWAMIPRRPI